MTDSILLALGLVLVLEGLVPFAAPAVWRSAVVRVASLRDGQIRFIGLGALVAGALLILL
jgi:uncharacterized protein